MKVLKYLPLLALLTSCEPTIAPPTKEDSMVRRIEYPDYVCFVYSSDKKGGIWCNKKEGQ